MARHDRLVWDERFAERRARGADDPLARPAAFVEALAPRLPRGRALDVAGGGGRNAIALARAGLDVTVVDISPVGLLLARDRAEAAGLHIATAELDLEETPPPPGPWDVILVHHYLDRALYRRLPSLLAEGGILAICHPTLRNLERHARPSARFLLEEGELGELVTGVQILGFEECWGRDGRHEARLVAARSRSPI